MVQVTFDTNTDTLEELQHALHLLEQAVARRQPSKTPAKFDIAESAEQAEETALETPFLKITVGKPEEHKEPKMPTLNQLINDESLTEEDLGKLFKEQLAQEEEERKNHPQKHAEKHVEEENSYIEIVEYEDKG
jgi:hypothetical protein